MSPIQIVSLIVGIPGGLFACLFGVAKVGEYVLHAFHNEHVFPAITKIAGAIEQNTAATDKVATALTKAEVDSHATFDRMGKILEDHEDRITALEPSPRPASAKIRRRPRAA